MGSTQHREIGKIRKILSNLEIRVNVKDSLVEFRDMMLLDSDNDLIILVLQRVHNILHTSHNSEYIEILLDIVHSEEAFDELFKIILNFASGMDLGKIMAKLKNANELMIFKYLKEIKNSGLFNGLSKEMDKRYVEILDTLE